jgi:hypothetical protein
MIFSTINWLKLVLLISVPNEQKRNPITIVELWITSSPTLPTSSSSTSSSSLTSPSSETSAWSSFQVLKKSKFRSFQIKRISLNLGTEIRIPEPIISALGDEEFISLCIHRIWQGERRTVFLLKTLIMPWLAVSSDCEVNGLEIESSQGIPRVIV